MRGGTDEELFLQLRRREVRPPLLGHVFLASTRCPKRRCILSLSLLHAWSGTRPRAGLEAAICADGVGRAACPSELFHPDVSEARELLDADDAFPHGTFADAEVLSVLERLGLRSQVTRSAVVQSARSVESLAAAEPDAAARRAKALLRYVDAHWQALADGGRFADEALPAELSSLSCGRCRGC